MGTLKWKKYDIDIYLLMISNDVIMIKANAFRNGCFLRGTSLTGINFFGLGMYLWRQTWKDLWFFWKCNFFIHGSGVGTNEVQKTYGIRMVEKLGNLNILWKVYNARKKKEKLTSGQICMMILLDFTLILGSIEALLSHGLHLLGLFCKDRNILNVLRCETQFS